MTDLKDIKFSFFADPRKTEKESHCTFGTLPFARHTSQSFAKVKEPNLPTLKKAIEINSIFIKIIARIS